VTKYAVVCRTLERLPGGNFLCHGDFHPGNILHREGVDYIIDRSGASSGDFVCDIARTYILLKVVPRVPGVSALAHAVQKQIGNADQMNSAD
jgi:Ser/Thr protein kinase RdoA (MazF antagonist)